MLQIKLFHFNVHKPRGKNADDMQQEINEWLKVNQNKIAVDVDNSTIEHLDDGNLMFSLWYYETDPKEKRKRKPSVK